MFTFTRALLIGWAIIALASLLHGLPLGASEALLINPSSQLFARENPAACPANQVHYPTVAEWQWALNTYCERHTPTTITSDSPLVFTYQLTAFDKKPIKWIFKVWIDGNMSKGLGQVGDSTKYKFPLSTDMCKQKFEAMVTDGKAGGMPEVICEVGSERLFRGGSYRDLVVKGYVGQAVWETRQMKGD